MCGIAGIHDSSGGRVDRRELAAMIQALRHRGPDGRGYHLEPGLALGHARLAVIDPMGSSQPLANEDETIRVICSGEIYNYLELRTELVGRGHRFRSRGDAEVIVHLYEELGEDFVHRLNGQYAIALWDARRRRLLLVRDRPGIAPLFYARDGERLLFGSEIKALLPVLGRGPALDPLALDQLMTFWSAQAPRTLFEGVRELRPGEMLSLEEGRLRLRRYWDWQFPVEPADYRKGQEAELAEQLRELLADATRLRLRADVPVAAYLSGGLDSSVIATLMRRHGRETLRTFSLGFADSDFDESRYQHLMSEHLGAEHAAVRCANAEIARRLPEAVWRAETPLLRMAPVPMAMLSARVREAGYRVVLSGEGADEVLSGYDLFKEAKIRQFWARRPDSAWRPLLLKRLYPYLPLSQRQSLGYLQRFFGQGLAEPHAPHFSHLTRWATTAMCKGFFSESLRERIDVDAVAELLAGLPAELPHWAPASRAQYLEAKTLLPGYLLSSQGDRMLMANAVEGRFPFLDHRVIEFSNSLRPALKMKVLNEKYLLKRAMSPYLPGEIVARHKQPYRAPDIAACFSGKPPEYVRELLSPSALRESGYFDPARVSRLLEKIRAGRAIGIKDNMAFVGVLSTQIWHQRFVVGHRPAAWRKSEFKAGVTGEIGCP